MNLKQKLTFVLSCCASLSYNSTLSAEESAQDLAKDLSNPLASIITVPFQLNYERGYGSEDSGYKYTLNIQPVIPFSLDNGAAVITRTIVPLISQKDVVPGTGKQSGLGDILFSAWYSPTPKGGLTWGVGPAILMPTSTDRLLGARRWAAGPTGILVYQTGPWTIGGLANHLWDFAGSGSADINSTFIQPFVAYNTSNLWTFSVQSESTYNWESEQWGVPINLTASKLVQLGGTPVSLGASVGYWLDSPTNGPEGVRFRLQANFVLPRK